MVGTRDRVVDIIIASAEELNGSLEEPIEVELGAEAPLYGDEGALDSLALVTLITTVEQELEDEFGSPVSLIDERAISQARSPFRTVGSLADFATDLLEGAGLTA
jgi:acyl carrier protein